MAVSPRILSLLVNKFYFLFIMITFFPRKKKNDAVLDYFKIQGPKK